MSAAVLDTARDGVIEDNFQSLFPLTFIDWLGRAVEWARPIVDHMLTHYQGVLKIEGEVGDKKVYDPRSYTKKAIAGMKERIKQACEELRSTGTSLV